MIAKFKYIICAFCVIFSVAACVDNDDDVPMNYYNNNAELKRVINFIQQGIGGKQFPEIGDTIIHHDPYRVLADFADYRMAQKKIDEVWRDREKWNRMSLMNIAGAGRFAADRAINDYARDIWNTKPVR